MMHIGVAIPVCKEDVFAIERCIRSIARQTRLPRRIVLAISECEDDGRAIFRLLQWCKIPITILATPDRQNAAQNRNRAADELMRGDPLCPIELICFFDVDDEMLPMRLEHLERVFVKHQRLRFTLTASLEVSGYAKGAACRHFVPRDARVGFNVIRKMDDEPHHGLVVVGDDTRFGVVAGNITIHRRVWEAVMRQSEDAEGWEDIDYCGRLIDYGGMPSAYLYAPLTIYHNYAETGADFAAMAMEAIMEQHPYEARRYIEEGLRRASVAEDRRTLHVLSKQLCGRL